MARTDRRYFALSAQQVDPLSWFVGPFVPATVVGIMLLAGGTGVGMSWSVARMPWLQLIALLVGVASPLIVHIVTRPLRPTLGWAVGAGALALPALGVVLSAVSYAGTDFSIELWWAPIALALAIIGLGPYLPARVLGVLGGSAIAISTAGALVILGARPDAWGPVARFVIIATPATLALAAMVAFCYAVVSTVLPLLERPSRILVAGRSVRDEAAEQVERVTLAQLTARAVPFIEGLADSGVVTPESRALAGQIARRLRDDLVTQGSVSWLDSIAEQSRLVVVDPHRLARRMTNPQRTALRALLAAVLATPGTDTGSLMVELRRATDGATAVAVSLDMALPEGRRIMHLAPYYLTLDAAVEDLAVSRHGISFRVTPRDAP
ncbi:MAG: hypothetical protein ACKVOG_06010 [Rhodoglobus sp.]